MKLNKRNANGNERESIVRSIKWCRKHHESFAGYPFVDTLVGSGGVHIEVIVPPKTTAEVCGQSLREAYQSRDVITHSIVECPVDWFQSANND